MQPTQPTQPTQQVQEKPQQTPTPPVEKGKTFEEVLNAASQKLLQTKGYKVTIVAITKDSTANVSTLFDLSGDVVYKGNDKYESDMNTTIILSEGNKVISNTKDRFVIKDDYFYMNNNDVWAKTQLTPTNNARFFPYPNLSDILKLNGTPTINDNGTKYELKYVVNPNKDIYNHILSTPSLPSSKYNVITTSAMDYVDLGPITFTIVVDKRTNQIDNYIIYFDYKVKNGKGTVDELHSIYDVLFLEYNDKIEIQLPN